MGAANLSCVYSIISALIFTLFALSSVVQADEGDFAADFSLPHLNTSDIISLSDYKEAVVLIDFWASWCGPCRASFPAYEAIRNRLQKKYGKERFEILAINVDMEKHEAHAFLEKHAVSFPILDENTGGVTQHDYQILAMPTAFLLDTSGRIIMQHSGFNAAYAQLIEKTASQLLDKPL